jgi:hypothetical protein
MKEEFWCGAILYMKAGFMMTDATTTTEDIAKEDSEDEDGEAEFAGCANLVSGELHYDSELKIATLSASSDDGGGAKQIDGHLFCALC